MGKIMCSVFNWLKLCFSSESDHQDNNMQSVGSYTWPEGLIQFLTMDISTTVSEPWNSQPRVEVEAKEC